LTNPNLSIWVVIKTLRHLCVIFNYGPDDCQGIPVIKEELMSLTLREASKDTLQAENKTWHYYSLPLAAKRLEDISRLPKSLKVLLENLCAGRTVTLSPPMIFTRWQVAKMPMPTEKSPTARQGC
jgi:aconitate hydratase